MQILLIEDDVALQTALQRSLQRLGWQVTAWKTSQDPLQLWQSVQPDIVLLDLNLPILDGLEILTLAREKKLLAPVIILTARGTVGDKILGLNCGADDYLPKPFDLDELEARIRALLRRRNQGLASADTPIFSRTIGQLQLDDMSLGGGVFFNQQPIELSPRELSLLHALCARAGHVVTKEQLLEAIFPNEVEIQDDAIEVVVYRLRKKINGTGVNIMNLRGLGYLIKASSST